MKCEASQINKPDHKRKGKFYINVASPVSRNAVHFYQYNKFNAYNNVRYRR